MSRFGSLNVTTPDGRHGDWVIYLMIVATFAAEMADKPWSCAPLAPSLEVEDCRQLCYGYVQEYTSTACKCMPIEWNDDDGSDDADPPPDRDLHDAARPDAPRAMRH